MKSAVCYHCGVRRPYVGMLIVEEVPEEGKGTEHMVFCDWKHLFAYAYEVITP